MLAAMPLQIALTIAVDVEPPRHSTALDGCFPYSGMDSFALPRDVAREAHIDREQARHLCLIADRASVRDGVLAEVGAASDRDYCDERDGVEQARRDQDLAHRFAPGATLGPPLCGEACGRAAKSTRRK